MIGILSLALAVATWQPAAGVSFQLQLQGNVDTSVNAEVFDFDLFDNGRAIVDEVHDGGGRAVCYLSAGTYENWRPDRNDFPERVIGKKLEDWPGERWLDIRKRDVLRPIMAARLDICAHKGFDGADFDNLDGYTQDSGFSISRRQQLRFNKMLARLAHDRGLAAGLKNVPQLVPELEEHYEFAVNEQCFQYNECRPYRRFIRHDKPVFVIEYELPRNEFCPQAREAGFTAMKKRYSLRAWRKTC
jgi:hypothetical protein